MRVRTITLGVSLGDKATWFAALRSAIEFLEDARDAVQTLGVEVQTIRVATNAFEVSPSQLAGCSCRAAP
jgi:hypothetical protein